MGRKSLSSILNLDDSAILSSKNSGISILKAVGFRPQHINFYFENQRDGNIEITVKYWFFFLFLSTKLHKIIYSANLNVLFKLNSYWVIWC